MNRLVETPLIREMYFQYGVAAHCGQNLEKELCLLLYFSELGAIPQWDEQNVEATYEKLNQKTLGNLLKKLHEHFKIDAGFDLHLQDALKKRNYLIHHFFGDNAQKFLDDASLPPLIQELKDIAIHLQAAVMAIRPFNEKIRRRVSSSNTALQGS